MALARHQKEARRRTQAGSPVWLAVLGLVVWLLPMTRAQAACPATLEDLAGALDRSVVAFTDMDAEAFGVARAAVKQTVSCPGGVLAPAMARQVHLVLALDAYLAQNPDQTRAAFRAVRLADPGYVLPLEVAPRGNLLRELFDSATAGPEAATVALATPSHGEFYVDGRPATRRPTERPFVLQWVEGGQVRWSDVLPAGAHLPMSLLASLQEEEPMAVFKLEVSTPAVPAPLESVPVPAPPTQLDRGARPGVVLLGAGGISAAGALGLGIAALAGRHGWQAALDDCVLAAGCEEDPAAAMSNLAARAQRARVLGYAAQGAGGLALGLGLTGGIALLW